MLFSDRSRSNYRNAPIHEVICQLRFPTILTINSVEPADFRRRSGRLSPSMHAGRILPRRRFPVWAAPIPRWNSNLL